ncbi:hypothetical protein COF09_30395 [Bacillus toyonensis]|uniref:hypothetical protein n=1 Tax=Bacillus toyonensis TaxID=155322 RepID=UPI000BFC6657|nr:hypothetical protein [Bacillus toyonensis]PHC35972.1 hypothetical protein COF09_30395 [Bacillus toyonensis]
MGSINFDIQLPTDADGYFKMNCPYCNNKFKLSANEFKNTDITNLYCPICGLTNTISTFYSNELYEKAMALVKNYAEQQIYELLKGFKRKSRSSKGLKIQVGKKNVIHGPELHEQDDYLVIVKKACCNSHVKVTELDKWIDPYCSYCGRK